MTAESLQSQTLRSHFEDQAFFAMARTAWQQQPSATLREQLGSLGRAGEHAMLQASGGVNTHRGAIWAIGLLVIAGTGLVLSFVLSLVAQLPLGYEQQFVWLFWVNVGVAALLVMVLLLVFVAYPVGTSLAAAFRDEAGSWHWSAWWSRLSDDRVWGLGCLSGLQHCGVAWNTVWLALTVGLGTTLLGLLLALLTRRCRTLTSLFLK